MSDDKSKNDKFTPYEQEHKEAEALDEELESPGGAEKLGREAYETAMQDKPKKGSQH